VTRKAPIIRFALLALAALALTVAPSALAGKGKGGTGGGLTLRPLTTDGLAHYGQQITFDVSTTATPYPQVAVDCSQGGASVYSASAGFYPSYPWPWERNFTLASSKWTGGAADCTAKLYYWNGRRFTTITTMSFHAYA
jgi:hypothetical protein